MLEPDSFDNAEHETSYTMCAEEFFNKLNLSSTVINLPECAENMSPILINLPQASNEPVIGEVLLAEVILDENLNNVAIPANQNNKNSNNNVKRKIRKQEKWKATQRKQAYHAGLKHINSRGKIKLERKIVDKKDCLHNCKYNCGNLISFEERKAIFDSFYTYDQEGKYFFIDKTTQRSKKIRATTRNESSRRQFSFFYYFEIKGQMIQVCKSFYLSTLSISQKPIYTVHTKKHENISGNISINKRAKSNNKHCIAAGEIDFVKEHINSFPCIDSHYCRAKTSRKYLDSNLNISKMYDLYTQKCEESNHIAVKQSYYRHVFNTNFNLGFHMPKSDRCGKCEVQKNSQNESEDFKEHLKLKQEMRISKENDNKCDLPVICFDLENVLTCPKVGIDTAFYLSKLNVYNLTAHVSTSKRVYCAIWNEYTAGRTGNDIASALYKILNRISEDHDLKKFITWSDSCVPQNKNSFMSFAMQMFLQSRPEVECIIMKYSLPGHSALQEVDNIHSQIEKVLIKNEYYSPIGLLRILKQVNRKKPFTIIQMMPNDFKNFEKSSKSFDYKAVPFTKLKMLKFGPIPHQLEYSTTYDESQFLVVNLRIWGTKRKSKTSSVPNVFMEPPLVGKCREISELKKKHIVSMFQYMTLQDQAFYKSIFHTDQTCASPGSSNPLRDSPKTKITNAREKETKIQKARETDNTRKKKVLKLNNTKIQKARETDNTRKKKVLKLNNT